MAITCPYCGHGMKIKQAKPGRYKPKCSQCSRRFEVTVPTGAGAKLDVRPLANDTNRESSREAAATGTSQAAAQTEPSGIDATLALPPGAAPDATAVSPAEPGQSAPGGSPGQRTVQVDETLDSVAIPGQDAPHRPSDQTAPNAQTAPIAQTAPVSHVAADGATTPERIDATRAATGDNLDSMPPADDITASQLGGYKLLKVLGRGAMGTVYLANQMSLDREVALKTIQARWCQNPASVARFTREAYAAAQLTHHNMVQIYDLGADQGVNYYSMEFVQGVSLDKLIADQGPVDPSVAAGYILQAARGLSFAHRHGMVHRDVKPANLLLSDLGIVKVADLGLVKTPQLVEEEDATAEKAALAASTANVTQANSAIGTPAFMAPEQAEDATTVDHRADIYSLGCTLYVLLTGRPPFDGATALEVITKHRTAAVVRPEKIDSTIPGPISDIVVRMIAKDPNDRFGNLDDVVEALEQFLSDVAPSIGEEDVAQLEAAVSTFNRAPVAQLRRVVAMAFSGAAAGLAVVSLPFSFAVASGWLVMLAAALSSYFVVSGLREQGPLFRKTREFVFSCRWTEWLTWLVGGFVLLAVLLIVGPIFTWLGFALLGGACGLVFCLVFDRQLAAARHDALASVEGLLKKMRIRGMDEPEIQQFVAKYGGSAWEELFESLFGYEAKLAARDTLKQAGLRPGKKFRAWREPLIRRLDANLRGTRKARDRKHLERVEAAGLEAAGVDAAQARQQAESLAVAMLDQAAEARRELAAAHAAIDPKVAAAAKRARIKAMLAEARSGKYSRKANAPGILTRLCGFICGPTLRFLLGCLLLGGCLFWMKRHGLLSSTPDAAELREAVHLLGPGEPLPIPLIGQWFDSFNPGIAGLLLIFTACFRGWKMSLFALPAAAVMVLGPTLGVPGVAVLGGAHTSSLVIGAAIALAGLVLGRTRDEYGSPG